MIETPTDPAVPDLSGPTAPTVPTVLDDDGASPPTAGPPPGATASSPRNPGPRRLRSLLIGSAIAAVLAVALFVGLGTGSGSGSGSATTGSGSIAAVGTAAPGFTLPSLTGGRRVDLDALGRVRHRPVVLNFFASWCGPCRQETPLLAQTAAAERTHGSKIQFIGVDTLDPASSAVPFVKKAGITYPVGTDHGQVSSGLYGLYGDPQTFFIAADGTILGHVRGALQPAQLQQWLNRLGGSAR